MCFVLASAVVQWSTEVWSIQHQRLACYAGDTVPLARPQRGPEACPADSKSAATQARPTREFRHVRGCIGYSAEAFGCLFSTSWDDGHGFDGSLGLQVRYDPYMQWKVFTVIKLVFTLTLLISRVHSFSADRRISSQAAEFWFVPRNRAAEFCCGIGLFFAELSCGICCFSFLQVLFTQNYLKAALLQVCLRWFLVWLIDENDN